MTTGCRSLRKECAKPETAITPMNQAFRPRKDCATNPVCARIAQRALEAGFRADLN